MSGTSQQWFNLRQGNGDDGMQSEYHHKPMIKSGLADSGRTNLSSSQLHAASLLLVSDVYEFHPWDSIDSITNHNEERDSMRRVAVTARRRLRARSIFSSAALMKRQLSKIPSRYFCSNQAGKLMGSSPSVSMGSGRLLSVGKGETSPLSSDMRSGWSTSLVSSFKQCEGIKEL